MIVKVIVVTRKPCKLISCGQQEHKFNGNILKLKPTFFLKKKRMGKKPLR